LLPLYWSLYDFLCLISFNFHFSSLFDLLFLYYFGKVFVAVLAIIFVDVYLISAYRVFAALRT